MARQRETTDDLPDLAYTSRWRAGIASAYSAELKRRAAAAELLDLPVMQEKILQAEAKHKRHRQTHRKASERP